MSDSTEVIDALKQARERVARGWCRQAYARDAAHSAVGYRSPRAVEWCSDGAIFVVEHEDGRPYYYLRRAIGTPAIHIWNDAKERTQAEVLAAFDKAIALASVSEPL